MLASSSKATEAARSAEALYDDGMFCCEAVLTVVNDATGNRLPPEIMSLGSGFWGGIAGDGTTCGALVGAIMAVGLLAGRTQLDGAWEESTAATEQVRREFQELNRATACGSLIAPFGGMDGEERHAYCAALTGQTAAMVVRIAEERGWI